MKFKTLKPLSIMLSLAMASFFMISCNNQKKEETKVEIVEKTEEQAPFFKLSLAQWSLNKAIRSGEANPFDFAQKASEMGFEGIEYVNHLYKKEIEAMGMDSVLNILKANSEKFNVESLLIMVDGEGALASTDKTEREKTVKNHHQWIDAAKFLGCHSIRVNAHGEGTAEEVAAAAVEGLTQLSEYGEKQGINILVENHGGYTSNGAWLADVMKRVGKENVGTLPDFGNFCQTKGYGSINSDNCEDPYDIYKGVTELMPHAKAVSAKSYDFDENGDQPKIDYLKMMQIVKDAGYTGFVGVEFEGENVSEEKGIELTRDLLIKVGKELSK